MDYVLLIFVLYFSVYFRRGVPSARTNDRVARRTNEQGHDERSITKNDEKRRRWTNERANERANERMAMSLARRKQLGTKKIAERNDAEGVAGGRRSTCMLYTASFGRGIG